MIDTGHLVICTDSSQMWLYSHNLGAELERYAHHFRINSSLGLIVEEALSGEFSGSQCLSDLNYLVRPIWDRFVPNNERESEGRIAVVDVPKQRVFFVSEAELSGDGTIPGERFAYDNH